MIIFLFVLAAIVLWGIVAYNLLVDGLRDVFEPSKKDEVQVVTDWSGDHPFTDPYVLRLDPDHPEDSIVMVRPWLRNPPAEPPEADG